MQRGWAQYLGFVDAATLPILYSAAGALVFPSIYEGFGLPAWRHSIWHAGHHQPRRAMAEFASEHDLLVDPEVDSLIEGMASAVALESAGDGRALKTRSGLSWQNTARLTADVYKKPLVRALSAAASS